MPEQTDFPPVCLGAAFGSMLGIMGLLGYLAPRPRWRDFDSGRWARGMMLSGAYFWPIDPRLEPTEYALEMHLLWELAIDDPARVRWETADTDTEGRP